jgi:hypothetical protein
MNPSHPRAIPRVHNTWWPVLIWQQPVLTGAAKLHYFVNNREG